ncbi:MAG: ABC transporter permease subunit [Erysipelotrichaceae bacterium]|jgi:NitT/TauT family transport system permease protein|nr:ABC transporter permease subunit [Erysipelotrichaceae bacterium]
MSKRKRKNRFIFVLLGILAIFLLWEFVSLATSNFDPLALYHSKVFPTFFDVIQSLFFLSQDGDFYLGVGATFLRVFLSAIIAIILGISLGLLAGISGFFRNFIAPLNVIIKATPIAIIVFILIVFAKGDATAIVVTLLLMFPMIFEATASGVEQLPRELKDEIALNGGMFNFNVMIKVILPLSFPTSLIGIMNAFGLGLKVAIMSEILSGSLSTIGLGSLFFKYYSIDFDLSKMFAVAFVTIAISALIDYALFKLKRLVNNKTATT